VTARRGPKEKFAPTNINFGLLPPPDDRVKKKDRRSWQVARAGRDLDAWLGTSEAAAASEGVG
jgi:methylenetetrahydrofolate--tRNA-(uracil-5-)-methyltransferase